MTVDASFGLSVLMGFLAFGIITRLYIWPRLRDAARGCADGVGGSAHVSVRGRLPFSYQRLSYPPLLVTHALMFWLLLRPRLEARG